MIIIYSADAAGRLFTDRKQRAYIDAELLREKATSARTAATLDRIAARLCFSSFDALANLARCHGVTADTLESWIISGTAADNLKRL